MQILGRHRIGKFENAVRQQLLPFGELAEMPLDLGLGGEDHRCRLALDDRLDRGGNPAKQFDQLRLVQLFGRVAQRLRLGEAGRSALRPAHRCRFVRFLVFGLAPDLRQTLRQVEAGDLGKRPVGALIEPGAAGAQRQYPERAHRIEQRQ